MVRGFSILHTPVRESQTLFDVVLNFFVRFDECKQGFRWWEWSSSSEGEAGAATGEENDMSAFFCIRNECWFCWRINCECNSRADSEWVIQNMRYEAYHVSIDGLISRETAANFHNRALSEWNRLFLRAADDGQVEACFYESLKKMDPMKAVDITCYMVLPGKCIVKAVWKLRGNLACNGKMVSLMTMDLTRYALKDSGELPTDCKIILDPGAREESDQCLVSLRAPGVGIHRWERIDNSTLRLARSKAFAFLMGTHSRLGKSSLLLTLDSLLVSIIAKMCLRPRYSDDEMLEVLFEALVRPVRAKRQQPGRMLTRAATRAAARSQVDQDQV